MNSGQKIIKDYLKTLPESPGVYRMLDKNEDVLYVGKAKNIKNRVSSYVKSDLPIRLLRMTFATCKLEIITTNSEAEALLLEATLIKKLKPKFNILLRDDKSFPYLKIRTDHQFPQLVKFRGKKLIGGEFFGPFASVRDLDNTISELLKIFKLRTCSDHYFATRKRPCLQYQIKRCSAPCVGKISEQDYKRDVAFIYDFLQGKTQELQQNLQDLMHHYSDKLEYEKAAEIRDKIKSLSYIQLKSHAGDLKISDADIIAAVKDEFDNFCIQIFMYRAGQSYGNKAFFPIHTKGSSEEEVISSFIGQFYQTRIPPKEIILSCEIDDKINIINALAELHNCKTHITCPKSGNKVKLVSLALENAKRALFEYNSRNSKYRTRLTELKELLDLEHEINRIEIYDNSHIMGKYAVGAMVVAGAEGFVPGEYRHYNVSLDSKSYGGDDYAMLQEVLSRRLDKIKQKKGEVPDLLVIDGGKGHMSSVLKVMEQKSIHIPFICMSKGPDRNAGNEIFHMPEREPFTLNNDNPLMKYLQILRDEVHNFAIKTHRQKRSRAIKISALDKLSNIGPKRKKALLGYFGSFEAIKGATINELMQVEGIKKSLAEQIYQQLNNG